MQTLHDFSGVVKFHELRQNASAVRDKIHNYGKMLLDKTALFNLFAKDRIMIGFGPTGYALLVCLRSNNSVRLIILRQKIETPSRKVLVMLTSNLHNTRLQVCVCVLHIKPFFLPVDIQHTQSVRADSSS